MQKAEQQADRRRLASPVRPEEAEDLALVDTDGEACQGAYLLVAPARRKACAAVVLRQRDGLDDGHVLRLRHRPTPRRPIRTAMKVRRRCNSIRPATGTESTAPS